MIKEEKQKKKNERSKAQQKKDRKINVLKQMKIERK